MKHLLGCVRKVYGKVQHPSIPTVKSWACHFRSSGKPYVPNIRAAQDNGLTSIGVRFDFAQEKELAQADHVVESFSELHTLLL